MSSEESYIRNTENAIRSIRMGTKDRAEAMRSVGFNLNKLKSVNPGMYDDLLVKYKQAIAAK